MAVQKFKLKVLPSDEAKALAADLLSGKPVEPDALKSVNATMGLKIELEADAATVNRLVLLIEKDLGVTPSAGHKT